MPWAQQVANVLDLRDEPTTQLVTGLRGSGKSSELRRLKSTLTALGYDVRLAQAGAWIRDDAPITTKDLLLAMILALYPEGGPSTATGWAKEYARQVWEFLNTEVRVTELKASAEVGDIKAELTTNDTLFQQVSEHLRSVSGVREAVFRLLNEAGEKAAAAGAPLVVILDQIETRATGELLGDEERAKYRNHWFGALLTDSRDLQPPIHAVLTVPSFLVLRAPEIAAQFGTELQFLPMVRVVEYSDTGDVDVCERGVRSLRDALFLRVPEGHFENRGVAAWLALRSGGYFRDLLRLTIECIYRTPEGGRITLKIVNEAIGRIRQTYAEGWTKEAEGLLRQIHEVRIPPFAAALQQQMDTLLQSYRMMRYHNSHYWYDVHPLLWPRLEIAGPTFDVIAATCP